MPDESCRKCGGMLAKCSLCAECKQLTQQICLKCGSQTHERFHTRCFYHIESIQITSELVA